MLRASPFRRVRVPFCHRDSGQAILASWFQRRPDENEKERTIMNDVRM